MQLFKLWGFIGLCRSRSRSLRQPVLWPSPSHKKRQLPSSTRLTPSLFQLCKIFSFLKNGTNDARTGLFRRNEFFWPRADIFCAKFSRKFLTPYLVALRERIAAAAIVTWYERKVSGGQLPYLRFIPLPFLYQRQLLLIIHYSLSRKKVYVVCSLTWTYFNHTRTRMYFLLVGRWKHSVIFRAIETFEGWRWFAYECNVFFSFSLCIALERNWNWMAGRNSSLKAH